MAGYNWPSASLFSTIDNFVLCVRGTCALYGRGEYGTSTSVRLIFVHLMYEIETPILRVYIEVSRTEMYVLCVSTKFWKATARSAIFIFNFYRQ